jgi:peptidoglycan-associated lipoprotein
VRVTVNTPPPAPAISLTPEPSIGDLFRTNVLPVYFDYDQATIRPDQVARLQASARFLQQNAAVQFTIGGHADERGSQEYNIGLGDRRANAVRQFLTGQGIAASRIETVSFGEERPVCTQPNEDCWSQNRRGEFSLR